MIRPTPLLSALALAGAILAAPAAAAPVTWPDASAASDWLQAFETELGGRDSATAVLQAWCDARGLAPGGGTIVARQVRGVHKPPSYLARQALRLGPKDKPRYRRVELSCGGHVLSQADNWYLPGKLTPEMNRALETTETPFGVVVKALDFKRRTLTTLFMFSPPASGPVTVPPQVLQHSALLYTGAGEPFSFVVETYTDQVLAFTPGRVSGPAP